MRSHRTRPRPLSGVKLSEVSCILPSSRFCFTSSCYLFACIDRRENESVIEREEEGTRCQIDLLNDQIQIRVVTNEREREREIKKEEGNASRIPLVTVGSVGVREKERKKDSDEKACDSYRYTCNWKEEKCSFSPFFLFLFV